jgi:hypothetical protein
MTNIPTGLVRTFVAVVDLRSFTKAAAKLGVTQPAVSAQIKRLQSLLGGDLFDRSVQGVSLTQQGDFARAAPAPSTKNWPTPSPWCFTIRPTTLPRARPAARPDADDTLRSAAGGLTIARENRAIRIV